MIKVEENFTKLSNDILIAEQVYSSIYDLPIDIRKNALKEELVTYYLLNQMERIGGKDIVKYFKEGFYLRNNKLNQLLKSFFSNLNVSLITHYVINDKPSSHLALEPLYGLIREKLRPIDIYFLKSLAGSMIFCRLAAVVRKLPSLIRNDRINKIVIPGCGSAYEMVKILSVNNDIRNNLEITCIDNNPVAIQHAKELMIQHGISVNVKYICADFMDEDFCLTDYFDMVYLVGIICPLPLKLCRKVINKVVGFLDNNGRVMISAALQNMLIKDPVTCFMMHFAGWRINYKSSSQLRELISECNLEWEESFFESKNNFHEIIIAKRERN